MGQEISKILNNNQEKEDKAKEQLELMMKLADARLDTFEAELTEMFLDNTSAAKKSVPGKRALRFQRSVSAVTSEKPSDQVESAVDSFFSMGDGQEGSVKKGALAGFKSVVKVGLSAFLGDSSAGESYDKKFFVCIKQYVEHPAHVMLNTDTESNAIVRLDMYTYRYNFKNEGIVGGYKSVMAYIICTSVVDHAQLTVDELVYLASEFAGDEPAQYQSYLDDLIKVWAKLRAQGVATEMALAGAGAALPAMLNQQLALGPATSVLSKATNAPSPMISPIPSQA